MPPAPRSSMPPTRMSPSNTPSGSTHIPPSMRTMNQNFINLCLDNSDRKSTINDDVIDLSNSDDDMEETTSTKTHIIRKIEVGLTFEDDDNYSDAGPELLGDEDYNDQDDQWMVDDLASELTPEEFEDAMARKEEKEEAELKLEHLSMPHDFEREFEVSPSPWPSSSHSAPKTGRKSKTFLPFNLVTVDDWKTENGFLLKPGMTVEVLPEASLDQKCGDFFRIECILQDLASDAVVVRGTRFRRANRLVGMLERKLNEVFQCQKFNISDTRPVHVQSLEDVPLHSILCERDLILTNNLFPAHSHRETSQWAGVSKIEIKEKAPLVCRCKHINVINNPPGARKTRRIEEYAIVRLSEKEADLGYAMSDRSLRATHRQEPIDLTGESTSDYTRTMMKIKATSGASKTRKPGLAMGSHHGEIIILDDDEDELGDEHTLLENYEMAARRSQLGGHGNTVGGRREELFTTKAARRKSKILKKSYVVQQAQPSNVDSDKSYTFGDAFGGAGGVSSGARSAGLRLMWAFDHWKDACDTYRHNFTGTRVFRTDAFKFITQWRGGRMVDILHLSPPCQKFSPAHTIPGKDDDANEASLFAVGCIVQLAKPRVVTIEETAGLQTAHPVFLHNLIQGLTRLGYSVRWKIMNLAEYGLAQPRKRLVIIASCPGEPLPPFPTRTHGPGLKSLTTIYTEAIRPRLVGTPNHVITDTVLKDKEPYNSHSQLTGCITTSGGLSNLHPSGQRTFTNRELACLQGFPLDHEFLGTKTSVRKQIGNAVPPVVAKKIYDPIVDFMRETDAREARQAAREAGEYGDEHEEESEEDDFVFVKRESDGLIRAVGGKTREDAIMLD